MAKWVRCRLLLTAGSSTEVDVEYVARDGDGAGLKPGIWDGMLHIREETRVAGRYAGGWVPVAAVLVLREVV
ncbi:hypothetical protein [Gordonia sp. (in: high G+C Gram-positive bacteria)]|uniref:hypothetical protein n=1 Tax=Gordonia sp. (in: high G+C Gram-positive bacteria) TaxID=84139 RepID=UPI001D447BE7|nr:hypothetical protein [Gordonia sp. (in: high G+C Gram-positive bacteria)]MCB1295825.1 hypothetical protein [Gordonia sp. (in: high G+C Gram-positive bacteria)]HMS75624.1 hypothetical protein [Gordonia sp. (in: high G+C Gram-positive bacteria)]